MSEPSPEQVERASRIRLLLMDVDGVWTDGNLFYVPGPGGDMVEVKLSHAHDGQALRWLHASGLPSGLISGRDSPGVTHRAEMLGMTPKLWLEALDERQLQLLYGDETVRVDRGALLTRLQAYETKIFATGRRWETSRTEGRDFGVDED